VERKIHILKKTRLNIGRRRFAIQAKQILDEIQERKKENVQ